MKKFYTLICLLIAGTSSFLNAQTVIFTHPTANNGSGLATFNFQNTNSYPVVITDVSTVLNSTALSEATLWTNPTPVNGSPGQLSSFPATGWTVAATNTFTPAIGSTIIEPVLTNISVTIPANTTVGMAVGVFGSPGSTPGRMRYFNTTGNPVFSGGGVNITTGNLVGYGITSLTAAPFNERGFVGSITFVPGFYVPNPNDAGLTDIDIETEVCGGQLQDIKVTLKNFGTSPLTSAAIAWTVNSQTQTPYSFIGNLDTLGGSGTIDTAVTIGSFLFTGSTQYDVVVWTELPNGVQDTVNMNDTVSVSFTTKPAPQPPPVIQNPNVSVCSGSSALLSAAGSADITWYADSLLTNKIGVGNNILSPIISAPATFYAANDSGTISNVGPVTTTELGTGAFTTSFLTSGVIFDVFSDCNIFSVKVFTNAAGSVTVNLAENPAPTTFLSSVTAQVTGNPNGDRITVNFNVEAGKTYRLVGTGTTVSGGLWRNGAVPGGTSGGDWNFTIPNMLKIRTSTSNTTLYYYNFYDWEVGTSTGCPGVSPVNVTISPVPPTPDFGFNITNNVVQFINLTNSGATYSWDFGDATTSTAVNPTKTYSATGTYFVTLTASNACVSNSQSAPQIVEIQTMGIDTEAASSESIQIYPNPSKGNFTVSVGEKMIGAEMTITNLQGQSIIRKERIESSVLQVEFSNHTPGLYFVTITKDGKQTVKKLMID